MIFSIFFMAMQFLQRRELMTVSFSEFFAFSEIKEALRRLLPASVHLMSLV